MAKKKKEWNVIAQQVCVRRGWSSSEGLPLVVTMSATRAGAIRNARKVWGKQLKRRCKLYPSAEQPY